MLLQLSEIVRRLFGVSGDERPPRGEMTIFKR